MKTTQDTVETVTDAVMKQREKWQRDNEIADQKLELWGEMREALERALPQVTAFVATDPNGERCGNPVMHTIRSILARADKIGGGK